MAQPAWVQMREKARIPRGAIAACSGSRSSAPSGSRSTTTTGEPSSRLSAPSGNAVVNARGWSASAGMGAPSSSTRRTPSCHGRSSSSPLLEGAERPERHDQRAAQGAPAAPAAPASSLRREMPPTAVSTACSTSTSAASSAARPLLHDLLGRVEAEARHDQRPGHAQEREPQGEPEELGVVGDDVDDDRRDAAAAARPRNAAAASSARSRLTSRAPRAGGTRSAGPRAR